MLGILLMKTMKFGNMIRIDNRLVLFFLLIFFVAGSNASAQVIDNKINVNLGYGIGAFIGDEKAQDGNFILPSLFNNYSSAAGYFLKGTYKFKPALSASLEINGVNASGWSMEEYLDYEGSSLNTFSIAPGIQFHNKFKDVGFANRFKLYGEIALVFGSAQVSLGHEIFEIQKAGVHVQSPMEESTPFIGAKLNAGLDYKINNYCGLFLDVSLNQNWIDAKFYGDRHFLIMRINAGFSIYLNKDKRFYY